MGLTFFLVWAIFMGSTPRVVEASPIPALERSPVESILRQSAVDALFQDRDGFLWIGSREGLVRWDGSNARYWYSVPFDDTSLPRNMVLRIDQDSEGHIWVVTRAFIHGTSEVSRLITPELERFAHYTPEDPDLAMDASGQPWLVNDEGVHRYQRDDDRFVLWIHLPRYRPAVPTSAAAVFDTQGALWILSRNTLDRCDVDTRSCESLAVEVAPLPLIQLLADSGRVRLPVKQGVVCAADSPLRLEPCDDLGDLQLAAQVTASAQDAAGARWLATPAGVWQVTPSGARQIPIHHGSGSANNDIFVLLGDRAGGMWAGTPWGLWSWDPHRHPFDLLTIDESSSEDATVGHRLAPILSLHEDDAGTLWVGTVGDGLYARSSTGAWRHFSEELWTPNDFASLVWSIASHKGDLWIGASEGLVRLGASGQAQWMAVPTTSAGKGIPGIRKVLTKDGKLWILTYRNGILRFDHDRFEMIYDEPGQGVEDLAVDDAGHLWLGTGEDGLRHIDPATGKARAFRCSPADPRSLSGCGIVSLLVDSTGALWVGTTRGLDRLADDDEHFEHVLGPRDLPSSAVLAILEGPRRLWLSTNRGLVSIEKDIARRSIGAKPPPHAVTVWDQQDGVGNLEFNRGAALSSRDGRLLFGGDRGITRFAPLEIERSTYRPPIRLDGLTLITRHGAHWLEPVPGEPIEIAPDVTSITFELATIDFTSPPGNRFALRLVGIDPEWIDLGTRRSATYAGVPPGRYTLLARVSNADGVWNDESLEVPLSVLPPFHRTPLFRAIVSLAGIGFLIALGIMVSRRRYQRQLDRLRTEHQRDEDRRRISRDLHDELGAGLTQIVLLSEKESRQPSSDPATQQRVADSARRLIDAVREIIWSIDPEHDRLDHLLARLRAATADMLEAAELRAELEFPQQPPETVVSPQLRRNLSLILREAVHNAIRHAQATYIRVTCEHDETEIRIVIADDGQGFDIDHVTRGNGLRNLRARARAINGAITIDSGPGEGTRVRVALPI